MATLKKKNVQQNPTESVQAVEPEKKIKYGFTVAVMEDNELVFNVAGTPGVVELLGLADFASKIAHARFKEQLNIDDVAIISSLSELHKKLDKFDAPDPMNDSRDDTIDTGV